MSALVHIGQLTPRPMDGGQVAQSVVEYVGPKMGAMTYRPPSGRSYSFSALASGNVQYVHAQDLGYFRLRPDFRIRDDGRIDPEAERFEKMRRDIVDRVLMEVATFIPREQIREQRRTSPRRGGRPAGRGFGALLECWMTCKRLAEYYGAVATAYDAVNRYFRTRPKPGREPPPRERYASVRSDAKRKREKAGTCLWHRHSEPLPTGLIPG